MDAKDRLRQVVDFLKNKYNLTNEQLSLKLNYSTASYVSDILGGNKRVNNLFLKRLYTHFKINPEYILSTSEKMIDESKEVEKNVENLLEPLVFPEMPTAAEMSIRKPKVDSLPYLVPFVDIPAQAGYTKAYSNVDYIQTLRMYPILPDVDPMGAVWRYFQVEGDSMEEEIRDRDVLLTSLVPQMDWQDIKDFYTHVIVTDEDLFIKDVLKEGDQNIILLSTNQDYKPKRLNLSDVRQIWVMRRHIKNRVKKKMYDLEQIKKDLLNK